MILITSLERSMLFLLSKAVYKSTPGMHITREGGTVQLHGILMDSIDTALLDQLDISLFHHCTL